MSAEQALGPPSERQLVLEALEIDEQQLKAGVSGFLVPIESIDGDIEETYLEMAVDQDGYHLAFTIGGKRKVRDQPPEEVFATKHHEERGLVAYLKDPLEDLPDSLPSRALARAIEDRKIWGGVVLGATAVSFISWQGIKHWGSLKNYLHRQR